MDTRRRLLLCLAVFMLFLPICSFADSYDEMMKKAWGKDYKERPKSAEEWKEFNKNQMEDNDVEHYRFCNELGYKFGLCSTLTMHRRACAPGDNVVIPKECRGKPATTDGITEGIKAAHWRLGLPIK